MKYALVFMFIVLMWRCHPKPVSRELLQLYIADSSNGLVKRSAEGNVQMTIFFRPSSLLEAQQLSAGHTNGKTTENFKKYDHFILNISKAGQELEAYYSYTGTPMDAKIQELGFGMARYVYAVYGQDTVSLTSYAYQRMYGATNSSAFMLIFDRAAFANKDWMEVCLYDFGLGLGLHKFRFLKKDMEAIPPLSNTNK